MNADLDVGEARYRLRLAASRCETVRSLARTGSRFWPLLGSALATGWRLGRARPRPGPGRIGGVAEVLLELLSGALAPDGSAPGRLPEFGASRASRR